MKNKKKQTHTAGPWRVEFANYARTGVYVTDGDEAVAILKHPDLPDFDATDNGALIASAPEMLEALEYLIKEVHVLPGTGKDDGNIGHRHINKALEAIKKARGES